MNTFILIAIIEFSITNHFTKFRNVIFSIKSGVANIEIKFNRP